MELYVAEYAYYVVELWQEFVTRLIKLLLNRNLEENVRIQSLLEALGQNNSDHDFFFLSTVP